MRLPILLVIATLPACQDPPHQPKNPPISSAGQEAVSETDRAPAATVHGGDEEGSPNVAELVCNRVSPLSHRTIAALKVPDVSPLIEVLHDDERTDCWQKALKVIGWHGGDRGVEAVVGFLGVHEGRQAIPPLRRKHIARHALIALATAACANLGPQHTPAPTKQGQEKAFLVLQEAMLKDWWLTRPGWLDADDWYSMHWHVRAAAIALSLTGRPEADELIRQHGRRLMQSESPYVSENAENVTRSLLENLEYIRSRGFFSRMED